VTPIVVTNDPDNYPHGFILSCIGKPKKPLDMQSEVECVIVDPRGFFWRVEEIAHMPIPIVIHSQSGEHIPAPYQVENLAALALIEPSGIYTVARTYHGDKAILLNAHFDRIEESARLEDIPLDLDRPAIRRTLRKLIEQAKYAKSRFRITIPREQPDQVIIALEPLDLDAIDGHFSGVSASTLYLPRKNPRAKSTEWIAVRNNARDQLHPGDYEGLRLSENGTISEGFSSNFYAIKDGVLRTAEDDILFGVSRKIVLTVAPQILPLELRPVHENKIPDLQEAFRSSSSRHVTPIVRINGIQIGDGQPGEITQAIRRAYDAWVEEHIEPI
jgi:branched-chain amino acid aminotransferase